MLYTILAMATQPSAQGGQQTGGAGGLMGMVPFLLIILVFWLLIIRPQAKKQKELSSMLQSLKEDDKVITTSGIYGRVISIKPDKDVVVLEIDDNNKVRVQFQRGAIATILPKKDNQEES
ncbi:MAG TPA: preprotein translocase subunit YajC [Candidatus Cloacimonadota bacterium]|nr:preprotein translocase subunit YajC [Candidatus Cloacimonadota bacterium]